MQKYWVVNLFDFERLKFAFKHNFWCMQQEYERQTDTPTAVTQNWKMVSQVKQGDYLIAYCSFRDSGDVAQFYAIGKVRTPRAKTRLRDTIRRYVDKSLPPSKRKHLFYDGRVLYNDAPAFYEDFVIRPKTWKEPWAQRIDVIKWELLNDYGCAVSGVKKAIIDGMVRLSIFSVNKDFFIKVKSALMMGLARPLTKKEAKYWTFCANPKKYDIDRAINELEVDWWKTDNKNINQGDRCIVWRTKSNSAERGVVSLGIIDGPPQIKDDYSNEFWKSPGDLPRVQSRIPIRYIKSTKLPLLFGMGQDRFLRNLSVAKARGGTVFHLKQNEWNRLLSILDDPCIDNEAILETEAVLRHHAFSKRGQWYSLNSKIRKAVETHAMRKAIEYFKSFWDNVEDVSANRSYDLECKSQNNFLHVEVKGTTTDGDSILLTRNEVKHAETYRGQVALYLLKLVEISELDTGEVKASGGVQQIFNPWNLNSSMLIPTAYSCNLGEIKHDE